MIYFVQNLKTKLVKIGYSSRHSVRLREITNDEGSPLKGLGVLSCERSKEKELHRRFKHLHHHGEWFRYEEDLETFVVEEARPWTEPNDVPKLLSVKLRMDVIESARIVAALRGVTMTELLSDILRPILAEAEDEEVLKRDKLLKGVVS